MLIRVKTESVREVFLAIDSYEAETKERLARAVNRSLNAIRRGAKARIHSRSGYLAKRIRKTFDARVISGTVRSTAPHAHLVEFGTHGVRMAGSKAKLRSTNPVRAKPKVGLFGRRVPKAMKIPGIGYRMSYKHHGSKAHPYMSPAFSSERSRYIQNLQKALQPKKR